MPFARDDCFVEAEPARFLNLYIYIYPSHTPSILFCVSPRLSRTRDLSPSFFHNSLLVQPTITVVCEEARRPMDGRTDGQWTSGKLEGGPRSIFRLDLLPPPTRSPSHEPLIALFAPIFFFFLFFSLFFFFSSGRKSIIRECKRRDAFRNDVVLSPHRIDNLPSRYRLSLAGNRSDFWHRWFKRVLHEIYETRG